MSRSGRATTRPREGMLTSMTPLGSQAMTRGPLRSVAYVEMETPCAMVRGSPVVLVPGAGSGAEEGDVERGFLACSFFPHEPAPTTVSASNTASIAREICLRIVR
ncbi:MAG: hypothetical protein V1748_03685 [Actinomycetota bacterium]